jgi:hypothetical protein
MRSVPLRVAAAFVVASLAALAIAAGSAAAAFTPGSAGLGDPFFPLAGNGGYDVSNYSLTLDYTPATNTLVGTAVVTARATQNLSRFDLDLRGFSITQLAVNGTAATYARDRQELVITPAAGLVEGRTFTVTVGYAGTDHRHGSRPVDRGLGADGRRRRRRGRAAGIARLVSGQRQPA